MIPCKLFFFNSGHGADNELVVMSYVNLFFFNNENIGFNSKNLTKMISGFLIIKVHIARHSFDR